MLKVACYGGMQTVLQGTTNRVHRSRSSGLFPMNGYLQLGKSRAGFWLQITQVAGFGS
ncbi:hypothetical protein BDI4_590063 [Burkholderia diffusa]|nr:hypothetical protein BDI4_590063 [Burkholderia diffusa]